MNEVFQAPEIVGGLPNKELNVASDKSLVFVPSQRRITAKGPEGPVEFEIFKVVDGYNPILKQKAVNWDFSNPPGPLYYIAMSMIQTMLRNGGVGLAANQCGLPYNLFVMGTGPNFMEVIVNPRIIKTSGEEKSQEGCLSFPGLYLKVKRATHIEVEYEDLKGMTKKVAYDGLTARIFLHEFDHLQGVKYTELVKSIDLGRAKEKVKSNLRKMKHVREDSERKQRALVHEAAVEKAKPSPTINQQLILDQKARQVDGNTILTFSST
jgi:peptide deformylase